MFMGFRLGGGGGVEGGRGCWWSGACDCLRFGVGVLMGGCWWEGEEGGVWVLRRRVGDGMGIAVVRMAGRDAEFEGSRFLRSSCGFTLLRLVDFHKPFFRPCCEFVVFTIPVLSYECQRFLREVDDDPNSDVRFFSHASHVESLGNAVSLFVK